MSWSHRSLIDAATSRRLDLDAAELEALEEGVNRETSADRRLSRLMLVGILATIAGGITAGSGIRWALASMGLPRGAAIAIAGVATPALFIAAWFVVFPPLQRGAVRRALRRLGYDVCAGCGYALEGLPADATCPECGRRSQPPLGASARNAGDR
ncbi:MAG: hypothetical protein AAFX79_12820 [Planctomycetota bacterium]